MTDSTTAWQSASARSLPDADADADTRARLARLYVQLRPAVLARCRFILGDPAAAEDATQETFLRVHRHGHRVPALDVRPWILRIATNLCLSELRCARRRRRREAVQYCEQVETLTNLSRADLGLLERVLLSSPLPVQQVVRLCCVDGLRQTAAASTLGVSTRTVAARLARFRRQLRRALRKERDNAGSMDSSC